MVQIILILLMIILSAYLLYERGVKMGMFNKYPYTDFHELNLDWILEHFKEFVESIDSLESWKSEHEVEYQQLKAFQDSIISGHFPASVVNAFNNWMRANAADLVGEMVKNVFFGLTDSGYFVAYIPDSWSDIIFNTTGYDINIALQTEYGHLVLSY